MKLEKVILQNFVSWSGEHSFELNNQGLVFLTGPNGAGKSSIFDAIAWALFGRTSKPLLAEEVVNNLVGKNCSVTLECSNRGKPLTIRRYRNHTQQKNALYLENYAANLSTTPAVQAAITRLIGCSYERFIQTFFFSQGDRRYFTQLGEAQQREIIGEVYEFSKFKEARRNASKRISELAHSSEEIRLAEAHARGQYDSLRNQYRSLKTKLSEVQQLQAESKESILAEISLCEQNLSIVQEVLEKILYDANEALFLKERKQTIEQDITKLTSTISNLRKNVCPTCKRPMETSSEANLKELTERKEMLLCSLEEIKEKLKPEWLQHLELEEKNCRKEIKEIRDKESILQTRVRMMTRDELSLREQLRGVIREKKKIKEALRATKTQLRIVQKKVQYYEYWEEGFGSKGIEVFALNKVLPIFNERVNYYLSFLPTSRGTIEVNFLVEKGHLIPHIVYEGSNKYAGASGGEKRRIDLCVNLALSDLYPFYSNLLLLDEVFDGIEPSAYPDVLKLLQSLKFSSIFVSSHNSELRSLFPTVWSIGIEDGKSKVIQVSKAGVQVL